MVNQKQYNDPPIDWQRAYDLMEIPCLTQNRNCAVLCEKSRLEMFGLLLSEEGKAKDGFVMAKDKGWCCATETQSFNEVELFPSEYAFREEKGFDVVPDELLFRCPRDKSCPRESRPFICRVFPLTPYVAPDGRIVRITRFRDDCSLEEISIEWILRWYEAWQIVLRHRGCRVWANRFALNQDLITKFGFIDHDEHTKAMDEWYEKEIEKFVDIMDSNPEDAPVWTPPVIPDTF